MFKTITRLLFGGDEKTPEDVKSGDVVEEGWLVVSHQEAENQDAELTDNKPSNSALRGDTAANMETDNRFTYLPVFPFSVLDPEPKAQSSSSSNNASRAIASYYISQPKALDEVTQLICIQKAKAWTHHLSHLPKEIPLEQLASGSPQLLDSGLSNHEETDEHCSCQDTHRVYAVLITFALGVTAALILHVCMGEGLVFARRGVLVSDHEHCTGLGHRVLQNGGSSVDAAITAALCLGVVHPHVSGVGGGGVMLVHDIHKNETRVINFQGTAPETLKEEMLENASELKVGLSVGVPGMLKGLHLAHSLYGSLLWEDVVTRATAVAKEGFNVSFGLAEAISKIKGEQLSQRFSDMFLPDGHALRPGSFLRMPGLAGVLEAGLSNFYDGNFSQEMEDEVRARGGVLNRASISNYSVQVEQPMEGLYNEFIVRAPPPPSTGAALILALSFLQGIHLNQKNSTENQTHHLIAETLKAALAMARVLGDPKYNSSVNELLSDMLSTLSRPFGSRILTQSGVILNSLILGFLWPNKARGQFLTNQKNRVEPGKRPLSSLMPIIVVPGCHKCGTYMALSSSGGQQSLSQVIQLQPRTAADTSGREGGEGEWALSVTCKSQLIDRWGIKGFPMEPKAVVKEKFFIVIRGKSRKGFCRGCIGQVQAETPRGELMGLMYSGASNAGSPKSGGVVRREDTYPLTRHQAQLLLFVWPATKRLELLCNPQLFSAICGLSQDDLVVVRYKKGHMPGLVKNLMQIGRKESRDDMHMLGFEVEFVVGEDTFLDCLFAASWCRVKPKDNDHNLSTKNRAPLPLFSAADIVQVVPSYSVPLGLHWKDSHCGGLNRKAVTRINSMPPSIDSRARQVRETQSVIQSQSLSIRVPLELESMVEVVSNSGITVYGVVRWLGVPGGKTEEWAGIELDYEVYGCSDGKYGGQRYFTCKGGRALFVPVTKCSPDSRFVHTSTGKETAKSTETLPVIPHKLTTKLFHLSFNSTLCDWLLDFLTGRPQSVRIGSLVSGRITVNTGTTQGCALSPVLYSLFTHDCVASHKDNTILKFADDTDRHRPDLLRR
ncbi:hypothetical protein L3Q82_007731 [Scortum barcoo]|uniref:Uncharacterized protein n=1 Tax=Scortum barcoo TaxID=214431 RepID=A0ACB8WNW5_9TELE|nr:hypothetical protein L3Q82_007731 [Scortum barcoo]